MISNLKGSLPTRIFVFCIFILTSVVICAVHVVLLTFIRPLCRRVYYRSVQYMNWTFIARKSMKLNIQNLHYKSLEVPIKRTSY